MTSYSLVALVPMRHHSERVPGKNFRELNGRPLYMYILDTLRRVEEIELVVVDTDSKVLRDGIHSDYPEVQLIERPERLALDTTPMNDVLKHDVGIVQSDIYLQTHSTNPMLRAQTIQSALGAFREGLPDRDSLFGVTKLQTRLWDSDSTPINHDPAVLMRTQDLKPVFEENSCLYLFKREIFLDLGNRIGKTPLLYEIDAGEAVDLDNEQDFQLADLALRLQG